MGKTSKQPTSSYNQKSKMQKDVSHYQNELPHSGELSSNRRPNEYDLANMKRKG